MKAEDLEHLSDEKLIELERLYYEEDVEKARGNLFEFIDFTFDKFQSTWFFETYYDILDRFSWEEFKNLIITIPTQHGKSEGSSRRFPAYLMGLRKDIKFALGSYSATKAEKFGREIINIIETPKYKDIFPHVKFPPKGYTGKKSNTNMTKESINSDASMMFVGIGGGLNGEPVDVLVLDDMYKGWKEANSPVTRQATWDWYTTVADNRLHNDSQQLIVFTRWHEEDIIGMLEKAGRVVELKPGDDIDEVISSLDDTHFLKLNFPALKVGQPNDLDPRDPGEALYPEKHSRKRLEVKRNTDPEKFQCLQQGNPKNKEGVLYQDFKTYEEIPSNTIANHNYTDTADKGNDYLCSICYEKGRDNMIYVKDVIFTQDRMSITEPLLAEMLNNNNTVKTYIESNNGGEGFGRAVKRLMGKGRGVPKFSMFNQGGNKEASVKTNATTVNQYIVFPNNWHIKWPEFYDHVTNFKSLFKANTHDDGPDVLTGILEKEKIVKGENSRNKPKYR